jgi:hypothetical protein
MIIMLLHAFDSGSRQFLFACIVFISLCSTLQEITFLTLQWDYDEDGTLSLLEVAKVRMYSIFLESVFHSSTFC